MTRVSQNPLDYANPENRELDGIWRFVLSPIGWPMHLAAIALLVLGCIEISAPGGYLLLWILSFYLTVLYSGIWIARGVARVIAIYHFKMHSPPRSWRPWLVAPSLLVGFVVLSILDAPLWGAFLLSEKSMERIVQRGPQTPPRVERAGVFQVELSKAPDGVTTLRVPGVGFMDSSGFAYIPAGSQPQNSSRVYTKLKGQWYTFYESD